MNSAPAIDQTDAMPAVGAARILSHSAEHGGQNWRELQRDTITRVEDLWSELHLDAELLPAARRAAALFPLRLPRCMLKRIKTGDPSDPVLRQYLPLDAETDQAPGFTTDPVGDQASRSTTGLLHKYDGRALLITTGACAVHCRYCFRRHYDYGSELQRDWRDALDRISADPGIREVILSGGDPLSLDDARLGQLIGQIAQIRHVRRLRIHTRLPVVIPQRVTRELINLLQRLHMPVTVVIHSNHAAEIDGEVAVALQHLHKSCTSLLNQSVLLRGVNDDADALVSLSERLYDCGVLPYYLHQLDRVTGAAHFLVSDDAAFDLYRAAAARVPGYLLPRLVREIAGTPYKTALHW